MAVESAHDQAELDDTRAHVHAHLDQVDARLTHA